MVAVLTSRTAGDLGTAGGRYGARERRAGETPSLRARQRDVAATGRPHLSALSRMGELRSGNSGLRRTRSSKPSALCGGNLASRLRSFRAFGCAITGGLFAPIVALLARARRAERLEAGPARLGALFW
jgi:hypothetical protein